MVVWGVVGDRDCSGCASAPRNTYASGVTGVDIEIAGFFDAMGT
jgi:hypothetical protein